MKLSADEKYTIEAVHRHSNTTSSQVITLLIQDHRHQTVPISIQDRAHEFNDLMAEVRSYRRTL